MEFEGLIPNVIAVGVVILVVLILAFGLLLLFKNFYRKVEQGKALIINKLRGQTEVSFTGGLVLPVIYKAETMDISVKKIEIDRMGNEGLICRDNIRADIKVTFFVRVNKTEEDVLKVAMSIGCERASKQETLEELFNAKFSEALKTVGKRMDFEALYQERDSFKDQIIEVIGTDLNGYVLEDAAIDYLEQTPLSKLDPDNILDSQGIRKITQLTAEQHIHTNLTRNNEQKQIKKQDVETQEAILELERQKADAEAKQQREIETMRAREEAETAKVRSEEWQRAEQAKLRAEEEIEIAAENKRRQVEVAQKNRERVIAIETERVEKDRALEAVAREREVAVKTLEKQKVVEREQKEIQDVIRERVAVEKTVAEEEERIKDLRAIAEAKRLKETAILAAEAEAQEKLVKQLKEAEALEQAAKFQARQKLTLAEAEMAAAEKQAKAKARLAEGLQAEQAASGLAEATVMEAKAAALEKQGLAEARALQAKMKAQATGEEEQGLARARVQEAEAVAVEKKGKAESVAIQAKLSAEAAGLSEKAEAMKLLDGVGREHEEFRLRLDLEKEVKMRAIEAQQQIAKHQAAILGEAFKSANFHIVGGDGAFFEQFTKAITLGKSIDGFVDSSDSAQTLLKEYLTGEKSLPDDLKQVLSRPAVDAQALQQLSVSAFLARMASGAQDQVKKEKLDKLLEHARQLGLDETAG